eukprot:TRINITY_DN2089_c0_g1_i3.p1 TRINITY_DN2089_c0_g1~~TRINITY_DN2089_c0_g1_i3.p1  ORF type:complete len:603 (-),score=113.92 TRINITY_DN2089_c0_g1_i3:105-1877(-)
MATLLLDRMLTCGYNRPACGFKVCAPADGQEDILAEVQDRDTMKVCPVKKLSEAVQDVVAEVEDTDAIRVCPVKKLSDTAPHGQEDTATEMMTKDTLKGLVASRPERSLPHACRDCCSVGDTLKAGSVDIDVPADDVSTDCSGRNDSGRIESPARSESPAGSELRVSSKVSFKTPTGHKQTSDPAAKLEHSEMLKLSSPNPGQIQATEMSLASKLEHPELPKLSSPDQEHTALVDMISKAREQAGHEVMKWQGCGFIEQEVLNEAPCNFGKVVCVKDKRGVRFAAKKMPIAWTQLSHAEFLEKRKPKSLEEPWTDIAVVTILNNIKYPFAMRLLGVFRDEKLLYVAWPLATHGDLYDWASSCKAEVGPAREAAIKPIASQVCEAIKLLHDLGIAHRDISLENVLVTETDSRKTQVKIIDFGMSTAVRFNHQSRAGKLYYQAPEIYSEHGPFDAFLFDAFAVGVLLFALATRDYPWRSTKPKECELFMYVQKKGLVGLLGKRRAKCVGEKNCEKQDKKSKGPLLVKVFSNSFTALLEGLLQLEPRQRFCLGEKCFLEDASRISAWGYWLECVSDVQWIPKLHREGLVECRL